MADNTLRVKNIIYLISHGHTARGAMQTGLLKLLRDKGINVTVVAKGGGHRELAHMVSNQGANFASFEQMESRWRYHFSNLRSYIHQDIRKNPALWEKHLRKVGTQNSSKGKVYAALGYLVIGDLIRRSTWLKRLFLSIEKRSFTNKKALELIRALKPDLVIATRPVDYFEAEMLRGAEILGVTKILYILSWDNITSKGYFPILADYYLTWGRIMNKELADYYQVDNTKIYNTGVTHFDVHTKVKKGEIIAPGLFEMMGIDSSKPYLFFTMSASYYAPNEIDIIEMLARKVEDNYFGSEMQLIIRPHMVNLMADRSDQSWLERLYQLNSRRVKVDFPSAQNSLLTWYMKQDDMIRLSQLINEAAVCLNSGSTIAIEAVYMDRPVVLTPFDTEDWPYWKSAQRLLDYVHLKTFIATGACSVANSLDEMYNYILAYLQNPGLKSKERKVALKHECYSDDGKATERFVKNIVAILNIENARISKSNNGC